MAKPAILCVDDDREVLAAVERDLRARYRPNYRILSAGSGAQALETTRELKKRGAQIALFLVDQRMPDMSGTELLGETTSTIRLGADSKKLFGKGSGSLWKLK